MARLIGFFLLVLVALQILRHLPILGGLFRIPILGFWLTAIVISALASKLAADALDRRRARQMERSLGAVDTPHNLGKLGSFLAARGQHRQAIEKLERAAQGEPDVAEWHYRLGVSRLALGDAHGATAALERSVGLSQDHAYGQALLRLAQAQTAAGQAQEALAAIERFEGGHGPTPESSYLKGRALQRLKRSEEATQALRSVSTHAKKLATYQRREGARWVTKAWLARLF